MNSRIIPIYMIPTNMKNIETFFDSHSLEVTCGNVVSKLVRDYPDIASQVFGLLFASLQMSRTHWISLEHYPLPAR